MSLGRYFDAREAFSGGRLGQLPFLPGFDAFAHGSVTPILSSLIQNKSVITGNITPVVLIIMIFRQILAGCLWAVSRLECGVQDVQAHAPNPSRSIIAPSQVAPPNHTVGAVVLGPVQSVGWSVSLGSCDIRGGDYPFPEIPVQLQVILPPAGFDGALFLV